MSLSLILGGLVCGGATFQQLSIQHTSLANVAFITGLYAVVVPLLGFFIGYRYRAFVWLGGLIAMFGLYQMAGVSDGLVLKGDVLALVGALFWAAHVLVIVLRASRHNQLVLAFYQFLVCSIFSLLFAILVEEQLLPAHWKGYFWAALNGVVVVGVAYTLQIIVLEYVDPFAASLIMSLEAVFGALAGYLVFKEVLGPTALLGAALMLVGCVLAQLPGGRKET